MQRKITSILIAATFVAGAFACSKQETKQQTTTSSTGTAATATAMPPGHPPLDQALQAAAGKIDGKTFTGTVAETKTAAGFTYVRLQTADGDVWAALPQTEVKQGQNLTVIESMTTENFESKSLGRKFDKLVFGKLPGDDKSMPSGHGGEMAMGGASPAVANPHGSTAGIADPGPISVPRAAGGKTVAEVWGEKAALKDKPVTVSGKVVKYLPGIMGKNWLHLRDGSGAQDKGTNDITVTTNDQVKVGDTVVVAGTVRVDKDFGAGYAYQVIIEDAKIAPK